MEKECSCIIKENDIAIKIINKPKIKLAKKIDIISLYAMKEEGYNEKTEQDKLSQNKAISRIISGQDTLFDIKNILKPDMIDKISAYYKASTLSPFTKVKWTESFINYLIRYNSTNDEKINDVIKQLKQFKKENIPPKDKKVKDVRDYSLLYQDINYRNKIYAKIKLDKYDFVTDAIISNTKIRDYLSSDTYIDIKAKKWIINEKKHAEINLSDDFIDLISLNKKGIYLINNKNNDKISSTVINNGISRFFNNNKET